MNKWLKNFKEVLIWFQSIIFLFCLIEGKVQNVGFKTKFKFFSVKTIIQKIIKSRIYYYILSFYCVIGLECFKGSLLKMSQFIIVKQTVPIKNYFKLCIYKLNTCVYIKEDSMLQVIIVKNCINIAMEKEKEIKVIIDSFSKLGFL